MFLHGATSGITPRKDAIIAEAALVREQLCGMANQSVQGKETQDRINQAVSQLTKRLMS